MSVGEGNAVSSGFVDGAGMPAVGVGVAGYFTTAPFILLRVETVEYFAWAMASGQ